MLIGSARPSYTGVVTTRCSLPTTFDGTNKQCMSRSEHISRDTISSLQLVLPNWRVNTTEVGSGAASTFTASIEYPAGTFTQVLFGGSASGTAADGANLVSDSVSVSIPKNTEFWVRIYCTNSSGILYSVRGNANVGDRIQLGVSGVSDVTMSGTVPNGSPASCMFPCAIIGSTQRISVALIGTSRTGGGGDTQSTTPADLGFMARSIGPGFGYINEGITGDTAAAFVQSNTNRVALANNYCSHVVVEYGVNDTVTTAGNRTTLETNMQTIYALFPTKRVYGVTIAPVTTYPANALSKDFSAVNTTRRLKTGVYGLFDPAAVLDSGAGTWADISQTSDGTHITLAGCLAVKASGTVGI